MRFLYAHEVYDRLPDEIFEVKWDWDPALIFFFFMFFLFLSSSLAEI